MPYKVIVADPSPSTRKAVQAAFQYPVFEVFSCDNGSDLAEAVSKIRPDALLVNLFLPGGDGRSLVHRIRSREEFKDLPVVFLRGTFEAFDIEDEPAAGRTFVRKPFDSEKLALDVRDMIDGALTPPTLPEDPDFEEGPPDGDTDTDTDRALVVGYVPGPAEGSPGVQDLEQRIVALIRREAPAIEKEVEKRLRIRLLGILKGTSGARSRTSLRDGRETVDPPEDA